MKLHLGCGQVYLEGYVNIDFPPSEHTVQDKPVADEFADLTKLHKKAETIDEIRLHHVFEHFTRPSALALLASWHSWLKRGGTVHIEVPDFDATAFRVLSPLTSDHDKKVGLRHIFGSNEAVWATHYEGWSKKRLIQAFEAFGFNILDTKRTSYLATHNIAVIAEKSTRTPSAAKLHDIAKEYLKDFLVDNAESEVRLLSVWLKEFDAQLSRTIAK